VELRGKQKRFLRAKGVTLDPILTIGKDGVSDNTIVQAEGVLRVRELIKGRVLVSAPEGPTETAAAIAEATFLLYKRNDEEPKIELPK
jgi:RNA-binding protein